MESPKTIDCEHGFPLSDQKQNSKKVMLFKLHSRFTLKIIQSWAQQKNLLFLFSAQTQLTFSTLVRTLIGRLLSSERVICPRVIGGKGGISERERVDNLFNPNRSNRLLVNSRRIELLEILSRRGQVNGPRPAEEAHQQQKRQQVCVFCSVMQMPGCSLQHQQQFGRAPHLHRAFITGKTIDFEGNSLNANLIWHLPTQPVSFCKVSPSFCSVFCLLWRRRSRRRRPSTIVSCQ